LVPFVSVIIPTYNRWPMVREAIDSVFAQTYRDFELIVVDDGSTDESPMELARLTAPVRVIAQSRRGVAAARNAGARAAQGRYLAFLDSDDLWLPQKLAMQTAFMSARSDIAICQTEEIWMRNGKRVNPKARHRKPDGDIFYRSLDLCLVSPSAVMVSRTLFHKIGGFDEALPVCEDYDLWLRIAADHSVPLLPQPLVVKRGGHADQLSHSLWGMDRFRIAALQKLLRSGLAGTRRQWVLDVMRRKAAILAAGARKRGRYDDALAFEAMPSEFDRSIEAMLENAKPNSRLRQSAGIPSPATCALASLARNS
jgi:glycosyltransferase involved in cell wall biosynthesis